MLSSGYLYSATPINHMVSSFRSASPIPQARIAQRLTEDFETKVGNLALGGVASSGRRTLSIMSRVSSKKEIISSAGNSEGKGDDEYTDGDEEIGAAGFTSRNVIPDDVAG